MSCLKGSNGFPLYLDENDFVGADMARKYLQIGFTRARRYANHSDGIKYDRVTGKELPLTPYNPDKAISAQIFKRKWASDLSHWGFSEIEFKISNDEKTMAKYIWLIPGFPF